MNKKSTHSCRRAIVLGIIPLGAAFATAGQTFNTIVDDIVSASPALAVVESTGMADIAALKGENRLEGPELEFERLYAPQGHDNRWSAGVSQTLPVPGQFSRLDKTVEILHKRNKAAYDAARVEIEQATRRMLIGYIAARQGHDLSHRIAEAADRLLAHYQKAYDMGEATIIDLNKARIEAARAAAADSRAETELDRFRAEIEAISPDHATATAALALTDYPVTAKLPPLTQLTDNYSHTPAARLAACEAEYARATASYASTGLWPRLALGYAHAFEEGTHYNGFTISLKLPAWGMAKTQKTEATQRLLAAADAARDTRNTAMAGLAGSYAEAMALERQLEDFAPAVAVADNFALLRKALDGGQLSLLEYLQETQYFIEAQREYITIAHDHAVAVTALLPYMQPM